MMTLCFITGGKLMDYRLVDTEHSKYVELYSADAPLCSEQDALDLMGLCSSYDTNCLLISGEAFSQDFFNLKTGIAGAMMQKWVNYQMQVAIIVTPKQYTEGRFGEMARESATHPNVRIYTDSNAAAEWLAGC